ncbi:hypothetical protein GGI07_004276 [Coemansia sp. Benny D115]|nr:hypothetical protein GGI07_004276 [Coemansia sp. Benny D115]
MTDDYTDNLAKLWELFPEMDKEVIDMVLRDNAGLIDPSVTVLLGMNDPSYKPDAEDLSHQNALQQDAQYARRIAQRDLEAHRAHYPGPQAAAAAAPPGGRYQQRGQILQQQYLSEREAAKRQAREQQQQRARLSPNTKQHSTSSKLKSILRLGKRSSSHPAEHSNGNSNSNGSGSGNGSGNGRMHQQHSNSRSSSSRPEPPALDIQRHMPRTLDSDFDTSSDDGEPRLSKTPEFPPQSRTKAAATSQQPNNPVQPPARMVRRTSSTNDVFGHLDASSLDASYAPLSPSKQAASAPIRAAPQPPLPLPLPLRQVVPPPESNAAGAQPEQEQEQREQTRTQTPSQPQPQLQSQSQMQTQLQPYTVAPPPALDLTGGAFIDLDHPFDNNPLLSPGSKVATPLAAATAATATAADGQHPAYLQPQQIAGNGSGSASNSSSNPFASVSVEETNPFRSRRQAMS